MVGMEHSIARENAGLLVAAVLLLGVLGCASGGAYQTGATAAPGTDIAPYTSFGSLRPGRPGPGHRCLPLVRRAPQRQPGRCNGAAPVDPGCQPPRRHPRAARRKGL